MTKVREDICDDVCKLLNKYFRKSFVWMDGDAVVVTVDIEKDTEHSVYLDFPFLLNVFNSMMPNDIVSEVFENIKDEL